VAVLFSAAKPPPGIQFDFVHVVPHVSPRHSTVKSRRIKKRGGAIHSRKKRLLNVWQFIQFLKI
jgi:hypothetical protein